MLESRPYYVFFAVFVFQHVMRFAEVTQEVQVARPTAVRFDVGLTPGRRKGNMSKFSQVVKS